MSRIALFAGSFDPFTIGHKDIVDRALSSLADEVVVAVGVNMNKKTMFSADERVAAIKAVYAADRRVRVETYEGLTTDFAKEVGASCLLRAVRSVKDYEYERDIAEMNRKLTGIDTVVLFTHPDYACISSSVVREFLSYGKDVTSFLP